MKWPSHRRNYRRSEGRSFGATVRTGADIPFGRPLLLAAVCAPLLGATHVHKLAVKRANDVVGHAQTVVEIAESANAVGRPQDLGAMRSSLVELDKDVLELQGLVHQLRQEPEPP